jgi:hypothetical protein
MKYFLWINETQEGPYEPEEIRRLLYQNKIPELTLGSPESGGQWAPVNSIDEIIIRPKPSTVQTPPMGYLHEPEFSLPLIQDSYIAMALIVFATLDFIGAVIGGLVIGSDGNTTYAICFAAGGILGSLILLGFAKVIENTSNTAQRLYRIEILIGKSINDKK